MLGKIRRTLSHYVQGFSIHELSDKNLEDTAAVLQEWRTGIIDVALAINFVAFLFGTTPFLVYSLAVSGSFFSAAACFVADLALLAALLFRKLSNPIRVSIILLSGYALTFVILFTFGVLLIGVILLLFLMPILALILIGKRAGMIASGASAVIFGLITLLIQQKLLNPATLIFHPWMFFFSMLAYLAVAMGLLILFYRFQELLIDRQRLVQSELMATKTLLEEQNRQLGQKIEERTDELEQRNRTLTALYKIADAASDSRDIHEFFTRIHRIIGELVVAKNLFIGLYEESSGLLSWPYFVDEKDEPPHTQPLADARGFTGYMIRTGNAILHGPDQFKELIEKGEMVFVGAPNEDGIGVPLKLEGKSIGALYLQSYDRGFRYSDRDDQLMVSVAPHIAAALIRFRALESERRRTNELGIINRIQSALAAGSSPRAILELIGGGLHEAFASPSLVLSLYDEATNELECAYASRLGQPPIIPRRTPRTGSMLHRLLETCRAAPLRYGNTEERLLEESGTRVCKSGVAVPIVSSGHTAGLIQLEDFEREYAYSDSDLRMLTTIAAALGSAFEKSQLSSQRNEAVEALRQSEEKFRKIVNSLPEFISIWDLDMECSYVSPSVYRITGYTPEERLVMAKEAYMPRESIDLLYRTLRDAMVQEHGQESDPNRVVTHDLEEIRKDGTRVILQSTFTFLRNAAGAPVGVLAVSADITERKRTEEALRESERRLADIIDFLPVATMVIDNDGRLTAWNHAMEELTGVKAESVLGKANHEYSIPFYGERRPTLIDLLTLPSEQLEARYKHIERKGEILTAEAFARNLGENGRTLLGFASLLYGADGKMNGGIESVRDVTELRKAEAELNEAKEAAEAANRAKSTFLANMSHEIRTPLNAILGFTQLMQRDASLSAEQRRHVNTINRSGEHLLALINDILEMSKIEAGRSLLNPALFDLHALLDDMAMMFRIRTDAKNLALTATRTPDLPRYVVSDEGKLRQVLINLLGNAVKFTEQGGIALRVGVGGRSNGGLRLVVEVEDTGPGIAEEEQSTLFDQFRQTARGIRTGGGTGLGLTISREFARLLGGDLTVRSQVGMGSVFRLEIAIEQGKEMAAATEVSRRRVTGLQPGQAVPRILIVDDMEENRKVLREMLGGVGFDVREAADGKAALAEFEAWQPDLIAMDMRMPVMDGYETTRRIKATARGRQTPVLAVTASAFDENREKVLEAGADDFISKPYRENELFEKIGARLGIRYLYDEEAFAAVREAQVSLASLNPASLLAMPHEWVGQMKEATVNGDRDRLFELIAEVATADAALAGALRELASGFRYDTLLVLLQREGQRTPA